jgi:hypothetical protein
MDLNMHSKMESNSCNGCADVVRRRSVMSHVGSLETARLWYGALHGKHRGVGRSCVGGGMVAVAEAEALWASGCVEVARQREG